MNIWEKAGIIKDGENHFESSKGELYQVVKNGINKILFKYEERTQQYLEQMSVIQGTFTAATRVIYTSAYWLPFARTGRIKLSDGVEMVITDCTPELNPQKISNLNKNGVTGFVITLEGG